MIYIVEFPRQGRAHAWFAFNRDDFVRKVRAGRARDGLGTAPNRAEPLDEFDASVAALARDLKACRVFLDDEDAIAALQRDPLLDPNREFYAHMALREQLIAMEAMEEDM
jgi:hypothetical protein